MGILIYTPGLQMTWYFREVDDIIALPCRRKAIVSWPTLGEKRDM